MKFQKGDTIIPVESVYPNGALMVDGYEADGTLLAHPLGGGFQYRFKPEAERQFRAVPKEEQESSIWRKSKFSIDGVEGEFEGWTDGDVWNGWAMPYFEFPEAERVVKLVSSNGRFDEKQDGFVTPNDDGEEDVWAAQTISILGPTQLKVYGVGAGAWIWEESD